MGPGDVLGVADTDQRRIHETCADDVELARDQQMHAIKAIDAIPGVVRIGEQGTTTRLGGLLAEAVRVRAEPLRVGQRVVARERDRWSEILRSGLRPRRLRADDSRHLQRDLPGVEVAPVVEFGNRLHPVCAPAAGIWQLIDTGVAEVAIHARHETTEQSSCVLGGRAGRVGRTGQQGFDSAGVTDQPVVRIANDVGVFVSGAEIFGTLTADRQHPIHQLAKIIFGTRIADAKPESGVVAGRDVWHTMGGTPNLGSQAIRRDRRAETQLQRNAAHGGAGEDFDGAIHERSPRFGFRDSRR